MSPCCCPCLVFFLFYVCFLPSSDSILPRSLYVFKPELFIHLFLPLQLLPSVPSPALPPLSLFPSLNQILIRVLREKGCVQRTTVGMEKWRKCWEIRRRQWWLVQEEESGVMRGQRRGRSRDLERLTLPIGQHSGVETRTRDDEGPPGKPMTDSFFTTSPPGQ